MTMLLLVVIYIAFIGLGLPDSLFGTAWPAIYADFELPLSYGSFVTATVSCGTILSSLISARLIRRFGTGRVSAVSTLLTAAALLGFSASPNLGLMVLLSIPLGIGAGAIDVGLNNYVALHYSASQMSFLHCFYGIGVSVSPYVLSLVISGDSGWRNGYRIAFLIQICISVLMFAALPLWKRADRGENGESEGAGRNLSVLETLRIPGVKGMCVLFFVSCAIECTCSGWGSTFLVEYRHMTPENAAQVILLYFVGMALGRFFSGVAAGKLHSWSIIKISQGILGAALVLLLIPGPVFLCTAGFFLVGFGNGPLFPNFNYLAPESFGEDVSQSVIGVQMAFAYIGILLGPLVCGQLGQAVGMVMFPIYLAVFFGVMLAATVWVRRKLPQKGSARKNQRTE